VDEGRVAVVWSVVVLLLIALIGGAVIGIVAAFGINAVAQAVKGLGRGAARR